MKGFIGGLVLGLFLSASIGRADLMTYEGLKLLSVELQRIANALDRLVSIESRKAKLLEEELDPNQKK